MVQFNLLPDVKLEFVKARRTMRMVSLISFAVGAVSLFALILLLITVDVAQRKSLHDLNSDITKYSKQVRGVQDLDKILTVQNQLNTLTTLHDQKVVSSRLFTYISQVTPSQIAISKLTVDFVANTISVTGQAPSLDVVNTFADTLKNTKYSTNQGTGSDTKAFSQVVLTSFGRDTKGASYTMTAGFDPNIFNSTYTVTLEVPAATTGAQATLFQLGAKN